MDEYTVIGDLGKGSYSTVNKVIRNGVVKAAKVYKDVIGIIETTIMSMGLPYIMKFDEVIYVDGKWVMIMDCMECDLRIRLRKHVPLKTKRDWVMRLATAINSLHLNGYSHSDLKPGNILVDRDDNIYLTDFSISSKFYHMDDELVNTLNFKTPESLYNLESADKYKNRADSWAFGMIVLLIYFNIPNWTRLGYNDDGEVSNYKALLTELKKCTSKEMVYEFLLSMVPDNDKLEDADLDILRSISNNNICFYPEERSWLNLGIVPDDPLWVSDMEYDPPKCITPRSEIIDVALDVMMSLVTKGVTDRYHARSFNVFVYILPSLESGNILDKKKLKVIMATCAYISFFLNHKNIALSMISSTLHLDIGELQDMFTKIVILTNGNFNHPDVLGLGVDYTSAVDILVG